MTARPSLRFKTYALLFAIVFFAPLGNVLLGKGMQSVGSANAWKFSDLLHIAFRIFTTGYIWLGIASLLTFFVAYLLLLTWADYSYVQPAGSLSYLSISVLSYFILGEMISPLRWLGVSVICLGVFVVGRTAPNTTQVIDRA